MNSVYTINFLNLKLLKLDDAMVRSQMAQLQSQLSFAKDLYNRQQNLWKEEIGTEVQVISAKNNVNSLERQIATLREQASFSNVHLCYLVWFQTGIVRNPCLSYKTSCARVN